MDVFFTAPGSVFVMKQEVDTEELVRQWGTERLEVHNQLVVVIRAHAEELLFDSVFELAGV